ncbi:MAG: NADH-quinone oxidoreductase subunit J [Pseudomonadota bacterium]
MIASLVFYLFATVLLISAFGVISSRNPVYSVLFLILGFFNAAGLFLLIGAEYLAMTLIIVYVGAVAVLFLFVVMMLNVKITAIKESFLSYLPLGLLIAGVFFAEIMFAIFASLKNPRVFAAAKVDTTISNTQAIGNVLYTDYIAIFQISGLILLVAMIGAIVLTHRKRPGVLRQVIATQINRKRKDSVELVKVKSGQGA